MENCPLLLLSGALLSALVVSLVEAILLRRERSGAAALRLRIQEIQELEENRRREMERQFRKMLNAQKKDYQLLKSDYSEMKRNYLSLIRKGYQGLGRFAEKRYVEQELQQAMADVLRESGVSPEHSLAFTAFIERALGPTVGNLKKDVPGLDEEDILLFCCIIVGFDASLISKLLDIDSLNTVYSRKKRLLDRIRKLPADKSEQYLELVP